MISAIISILSKPPSLFQAACFSNIRTRRICSSLYDEASSLIRMSLRTRAWVAANSDIIKRISCFGKVIFRTQIKTKCLKLTFSCRSRCLGLPPKSPGFLAILALMALLRLLSPHALVLFLALSIGNVLSDGTLRYSFNPADVLPSCPV